MPSIANGMISKVSIKRCGFLENIIYIIPNKYPINIPVHLAHIGNCFPL